MSAPLSLGCPRLAGSSRAGRLLCALSPPRSWSSRPQAAFRWLLLAQVPQRCARASSPATLREVPAKMLPLFSWPGRGALSVAALTLVLLVCLGPGVSQGNKLTLMLQKREAPVPVKVDVSVNEDKAKEFLSSLKRQKRQLWDRSQPDVQQWYQHFLYLGFDEAKFEDDVSYWSNLGRSGHEYYGGYYQHHYDEDAPIGPRNPQSFRHGASVNYDDY